MSVGPTMTTMAPVRVCAVAELAEDEAVLVEILGQGTVAVFFTEDSYFGIADRCSHQKASLSDGFVDNCAVECPLHSSAFSLRTGVPDGPPATAAVAVYDAWSDGESVFVNQVPHSPDR